MVGKIRAIKKNRTLIRLFFLQRHLCGPPSGPSCVCLSLPSAIMTFFHIVEQKSKVSKSNLTRAS